MRARLFGGLSLAECTIIASRRQERRLPGRETIFREGDAVRSVFLIASGWVKTTQVSYAGQEVILRIEGPGEVPDQLEIPCLGVHPFTARTITPCLILSWNIRVFESLMESFPALQRNVRTILAMRLRTMEERFRDLATTHVHQRLARMLMFLHQRRPEAVDMPEIALSCEELAQMTGTTLFTVSRVLREWEERGIIQRQQKVIRVESLPDLLALAEHSDPADLQDC